MGMTWQEPVAVPDIGAMGHNMAASALRAGIPAMVWDRRPAATRDEAMTSTLSATPRLIGREAELEL
jgi:3-hydroxyisobutyrate dehydrogenase-like beta-hydroxyacid dehydrogenase